MKAFFCSCFLLFVSISGFSQLVINELSSANDAVIADEDGDFEDWIELYNPTGTAIALENYTFTYEVPGEPAIVWTFPKVFIQPNQHMLIFASEKDRKVVIDHWEVPVWADSVWRYRVNVSNGPAVNWYTNGYSDATWQQGPGGFGYGDNDDQTITPQTPSVFLRKQFNIPDTSKYPLGVLMIDYDDSFVAFLNGNEVARSNIGVYGDHPAYNVSAYEEHEAQIYQGGDPQFFLVPLKGILVPGNNVLAVQVHNYSSGMNDLTAMPWLIIGNTDTTKNFLSFPSDFNMHTSFSLSSSKGFKLTLRNDLGIKQDSVLLAPNNIRVNNSYGRNPDGGINWCLFWAPSPKDTNDINQCFSTYCLSPGLSLPAGFYNGQQTLSITVNPGTVVFYTRNGDDPDPGDTPYTGPISIDSTQVIRARAWSIAGTDLPSPIITRSYFINETITLPVISISTDSMNLWDWNTGLYVMGPNADTTLPYPNANFWMDWRKQGHTEYFTKSSQLGFRQDGAIKIHGNFSKAWPQKSFRVLANDDYQDPYMNYQFFPDKNITKFRSFNIRNAGIDWNTCHFRDRLMNKLVQDHTNIDMMDGEAVVLFLNGKYWGVYELRERQDEHYLSENHNVNPDSVDLLRFEGDILEGSNQAFFDMVGFFSNNNLSIQANYDSAQKLMDIENYCDYFISETYYNNWDWIWTDLQQNTQGTNNIKFWRTNNPPSKWRYILWDTDLGMSLFGGVGSTCPENLLGTITHPSITKPSYHVVMLKAFLTNNDFKDYFLNRYCDLMNTVFHPDTVIEKVHDIRDELLPEMARHFNRWNQGPINIFGIWDVGRSIDVPTWLNEIDTLEAFVNCRPYNVRDSLQAQFGLTKQVDVTLDVSPPGAGTIHLNTIDPGPMPWTGAYFDGVPVTMTAKANPGFKFLYWDAPFLIANPDTHLTLSLNVTQNETFTAFFDTSTIGVNESEVLLNAAVFPNPFDDQINLSYTLTSSGTPTIKLFDLVGKEIVNLHSASTPRAPGNYNFRFSLDQFEISPGVYFLQVSVGRSSKSLKLVKWTN